MSLAQTTYILSIVVWIISTTPSPSHTTTTTHSNTAATVMPSTTLTPSIPTTTTTDPILVPTPDPTSISITDPTSTSTTDTRCAAYYSYCLIGLSPTDYASFIGARYEYKGIDEGCKYFENTQLPTTFDSNVYIHWDDTLNKWYIGSSLSSTDYWAYCTYSSLDSCILNTWTRFDGTSAQPDYSMSIVPCTYDNNQCLTQYNNTFGKSKHNDQDFCIRNTHDRSINHGISDSFSVSGCSEEKQYYTSNDGVGTALTISWDNEMSVWFLHNHYDANVVAWSHIAYCTFNDLKTCSNNWYIWDGEDTTKDSAVISGLCNTCTDTRRDTFCIYGGIGRDQFELMVGIYEYDTCIELMHSYNHTQYDDYYANNVTHGGNLTLHYYCADNSWRIDVDYNKNISYAVCDEFDDVMDCSGNWTVFDAINDAWDVKQTIQSGSCDVIYQQCFNSNSDENEQYLCITEDENDELVWNNDNYYQYIAGEFKYLECDEEGFPIYVRHRDNNGNYLNESWFNYSLITWDSSGNLFSVHKYNKALTTAQKGHWLYCRSLLVELCDTFWNLYDNNTDDWIPSPSIRITKQKCNFATDAASIFDIIKENLIYFVIALVLVLLCCICCLFFLYKKRKNKDEIVSTPQKTYPANNNIHQAVPSSSAPRVQYVTVHTIPNTPDTPVTPQTQYSYQITQKKPIQTPEQTINSYKKKPTTKINIQQLQSKSTEATKKESYAEAAEPPPYNPKYDSLKRGNINQQQAFGHVTVGDMDAVLDAMVNDEDVNESAIAKWNKNDIIEWINSISLSPQWKEILINCVSNGQYDGGDILKINSGKDIAKLFAIQNPMLCSRLWKELKKIK